MELEEIIQRSKARPEIYAPALAMEALRLRAERDQLVAALRIIAGYDPGHNQGDDRSIAIRALRGESTCPG